MSVIVKTDGALHSTERNGGGERREGEGEGEEQFLREYKNYVMGLQSKKQYQLVTAAYFYLGLYC